MYARIQNFIIISSQKHLYTNISTFCTPSLLVDIAMAIHIVLVEKFACGCRRSVLVSWVIWHVIKLCAS